MIILIVGMHRSGTSLVARGLHAMGVNLGTRIDTTPHPSNPHGHWEHSDVWPAQERLLIAFGREWHSSPGPLPPRWQEWPDTRDVIDRFAVLAAAELAAHGHWLVKDPRSSLLIPLWRQVAGRIGSELRILRVFRDADEVAASLATRNGMPRELAVRIWNDHQQSIDRDARGLAVRTFRHADILLDPVAAFTSMAAFCGLADAHDRAGAAVAVVEPGLWHHRGPSVAPDDAAAILGAIPKIHGTAPPDLGRVLVVMRTRWRLHMLPRALRSVLAQTYPHWFLQIVNDGGPPHLVESEIAPYRHLLDGRLGILHRDRQYGMEAASNAGIAAGPGEFIALHDDDDSWSPEFLERMVGRLHATGRGAAVCRSRIVTEAWDSREYVRTRVLEFGPETEMVTAGDLAGRNVFPPIALLFRRSMFEAVGPYHEGLPALGDWQFNKRLAAGEPIDVVPEYLAFWHLREASDRVPNSPRLDHWRAEAFVKAWPASAPLPEFFSQARQVRFFGSGAGCGVVRPLTNHAAPAPAEESAALLPAGLYLIRVSLGDTTAPVAATTSMALWYRTTAEFTHGQSVPLAAELGSPAAVILNAAEPILELGISAGGDDVQPLPHAAEALRLGNALSTLDDFAGPPRLPDVLCIGAQRSGTTWLHAVLQQHPRAWACGIKEFHHFDQHGSDAAIGEFRQRQALAMLAADATGSPDDVSRSRRIRLALRHGFPPAPSWDNYAAIFQSAPDDRLACDFTPAYAALDDDAVAEIARVMPDVKVIFILRDPVTRAVSGGLHQLRREGVERPTAAQLLAACDSPANLLRTDYVRTLDIWQRHLPEDRLLVLVHDDIASDPAAVIARTCRFLGIEPLRAEIIEDGDRLTARDHGEAPLSAPELARVKAELARHWLPMLLELERRFGEPVRPWRLAAERRVLAAAAADAGGGAGREHTVQNNLAQWDARDPWTGAGDGWDGQARACGIPYADWKAGLMARYLPRVPAGGTLLEIGPGHGRWSEMLIDRAGILVLCDISPNCLDTCRQRLVGRGRLRTWLSHAADLPGDLTAGVDAVWSYDCLVHVAPDEFAGYIGEIARVLRPGGVAVLHHADRGRGGLLRRVAGWFSRRHEGIAGLGAAGQPEADHGWRSPISRADVRRWARASGLRIVRQESTWTWRSPRGPIRIGVPRFGDCITVLQRP